MSMLSTSMPGTGSVAVSPRLAPTVLLTRATASALVRVSQKTIDRAVAAGELEIAEYRGHRPRFRESDVLQWNEKRRESKAHDPYTGALCVVDEIAQREMA